MLSKKNFGSPDETRPFQAKGSMRVVALGDATIGHGTFEPGWKWSEHVRPWPAPTAAMRITPATWSRAA
jgi:hypothetical protein